MKKVLALNSFRNWVRMTASTVQRLTPNKCSLQLNFALQMLHEHPDRDIEIHGL